ncbi:Nn.00g039090.m01.CDS01 [Neocucurbitaria sp. VM-36]
MPPSKSTTPGRPAPLACLECRRAHLRCDGVKPACARCTSRGTSCSYTISRRGRRRGTKQLSDRAERVENPSLSYYLSPVSQWTPDHALSLNELTAGPDSVDHSNDSVQPELPSLQPITCGSSSQQVQPITQWVDDERLVNLYYINFHPNHPILLPRSLYWKRNYPRFLKAVVEFIGSHFLATLPSRKIQENVEKELEQGDQDTPEMVQARILYATLLLARNESYGRQQMLAHAIDSAMKLGMYRREFATSQGYYDPVAEESMRRTWYELYVLDGCIAAFRPESSFKTNTVNADVLLPCEDSLYEHGMCLPSSASRDDFENSVFTDEETVFSSFCYRIEAVRLLGRVLSITGEHGIQREQVQAADNALAAFLHHLPSTKREPEIVNFSGEVDWLMFQAHMIIQYATILLHFPRGDLASPGPIATGLPGDSTAKFVCPCTRQHVHSTKAIDASKAISMLAAFRIPIQRQTPLFIYPLALGAVVQLSVCTVHSKNSKLGLEQHRDRVKLILGVLKSLGRYWSIAEVLLRALKKVALRVFQPLRGGYPVPGQQEDSTDSPYQHRQEIASDISLDDLDLHSLNELIGLDTDVFCF